MDVVVNWIALRLRPGVGWWPALLAAGAAMCPAVAAVDAVLPLPAGLLAWAGLVGCLLGLLLARPAQRALRLALGAALIVGGGVTLIAATGDALPPPALVIQDLAALLGRVAPWLRGEPLAPGPIALRSPQFLALALPRLAQALRDAPFAGEAGAALMLATVGALGTWLGAFVLGWALGAGRQLHAWGLPLLGVLLVLTLLGGSNGTGLAFGLGLLLILALVAGLRARQLAWERAGTLFSDELLREALFWGVGAVVGALLLAAVLPTRLPNPLAWLAPPAALPSGLAALERQLERPAAPSAAVIALPRLPAVALGVSLEQGAPEQLSLRVGVDAPFPPGPWPRYWRARLLDRYNGRAWSAELRPGSPATLLGPGARPEGLVAQRVEDLRRAPTTLIGLPEVIALDAPARAALLADGSVSALVGAANRSRYTLFSLPQAPAESVTPATGAPEQQPRGETLALPPGLPPRVGELARTLAAGANTPIEQALAIEAYLRGLPYSYRVRPLPRDGDAVDQFLFEMGEGYCTYYASAMAVLARSLGIPARLAVGYATGSYDAAGRAYVVREAEAHAWPELFIDGQWLPFEPTPVRPLPARGEATPVETTPAPPAAELPQPLAGSGWLWLPALLAAGLALACGGYLVARRAGATPLLLAQRELERAGARAGVVWAPGATLREYGALLRGRDPVLADPVAELIGLAERAHYSGRQLDAAEQRRLRELARGLRRLRGQIPAPPGES